MENLNVAQKQIMQKLSCLEKDVEHIEAYKEEICFFSDEEIKQIIEAYKEEICFFSDEKIKQIKEKLQNAICYIESIIDEIEDI